MKVFERIDPEGEIMEAYDCEREAIERAKEIGTQVTVIKSMNKDRDKAVYYVESPACGNDPCMGKSCIFTRLIIGNIMNKLKMIILSLHMARKHYFNPLHIYCRMINCGVNCARARALCTWLERKRLIGSV